jgi:hypothetical protein
LLLLALLRTLWRLSYQDLHDWLVAWPTLALACGLPRDGQGQVRVPSPAQQCKRGQRMGAPPCELLFVVLVQLARHTLCWLLSTSDHTLMGSLCPTPFFMRRLWK